MKPVQQTPLRPHTQQTSSDIEDHPTQADEKVNPMDQDDGPPIHSDDETHQSQILGNTKKTKKLKTERESSKYRDRMRSRSRNTTPQQ